MTREGRVSLSPGTGVFALQREKLYPLILILRQGLDKTKGVQSSKPSPWLKKSRPRSRSLNKGAGILPPSIKTHASSWQLKTVTSCKEVLQWEQTVFTPQQRT